MQWERADKGRLFITYPGLDQIKLRADSQDEADRWVKCISAAVKQVPSALSHRQAKLPIPNPLPLSTPPADPFLAHSLRLNRAGTGTTQGIA